MYKCTGGCLKRLVLRVNQRQMKPGPGFHEEGHPVDAILQRLLLALFCLSCAMPLCATVLLNTYFTLNHAKRNTSLQKVKSEGMYSAAITQASSRVVGDSWSSPCLNLSLPLT